ncbi:MAG: VPLPA-CTERM sorting domain-containing protein [Sulfuricaulis sp.]
MNPTSFRKTLIASSIALSLGTATAAHASLVTNVFGANTWSTDSANFSMLAGGSYSGYMFGVFGGANDVRMSWDGNAYNSSTDYTGPGGPSNVTASSTTLFGSHRWTAHDIQMFTPGTYTFDTSLGGGNPESGIMNITVPSGDLGMHMLWLWNGNNNIDIFDVFAQNSVFGSGIGYTTQATPSNGNRCSTSIKNCLWDGTNYGSAGKPAGNKVWMLASVVNGSSVGGVPGVPMAAGGPFAGWNSNFNAMLTPAPKAVPVPVAVWLFGSGLLGLFGVAKRRKK